METAISDISHTGGNEITPHVGEAGGGAIDLKPFAGLQTSRPIDGVPTDIHQRAAIRACGLFPPVSRRDRVRRLVFLRRDDAMWAWHFLPAFAPRRIGQI